MSLRSESARVIRNTCWWPGRSRERKTGGGVSSDAPSHADLVAGKAGTRSFGRRGEVLPPSAVAEAPELSSDAPARAEPGCRRSRNQVAGIPHPLRPAFHPTFGFS